VQFKANKFAFQFMYSFSNAFLHRLAEISSLPILSQLFCTHSLYKRVMCYNISIRFHFYYNYCVMLSYMVLFAVITPKGSII